MTNNFIFDTDLAGGHPLHGQWVLPPIFLAGTSRCITAEGSSRSSLIPIYQDEIFRPAAIQAVLVLAGRAAGSTV